MDAYSMDLRERVAAAVDGGTARRAAARTFRVSPSFVTKLLRRRRETGSLAARPRPPRPAADGADAQKKAAGRPSRTAPT